MILAVSLTIFASFLWAITNHMDKFLVGSVDESGSSMKTILTFSTLVAGIIISPIWLIVSRFQVSIGIIPLLCVLLSSFIYILATYLYFKALEKNDASIIVVMFQLIPVFSYILELIFFKESLSVKQIIGALVIIASTVLISLDFESKKKKVKWLTLILMALSSLLFSTYYFLFDVGMRNSSYNSTAFWFQIGLLILGLIFISIKSFRTTFVHAIKSNGKKYISLNLSNEVLNLIASLLVNFANVTLPLALANVLNCFQSSFVFILGVIGINLLPKYFKESVTKRIVIQKISCMILSITGLIILFI